MLAAMKKRIRLAAYAAGLAFGPARYLLDSHVIVDMNAPARPGSDSGRPGIALARRPGFPPRPTMRSLPWPR